MAVPSESDLGREYFEKHIRPLLVSKCLKCHSGESPKGGLSLEYQRDWASGGSRGRAIKPGQPEQSLLIQVVTGRHPELKMPAEGAPLTPLEIGRLTEWVRLGAFDPRKPSQPFKAPKVSSARVATHWAFKPIRRPRIPGNSGWEWERTPVDAFVLRQIEKAGLAPAPAADPRIKVRRLYLNLIGMPPTFAEMERDLAESARGSWTRLVDRLLADPRYGERWGRHWLDVARYADSAGYRAVGQQRRFPYSYTYRDYVVEAFNAGLPFDQFVREQIAADRIPGLPNDRLAAMGFLTVGKTFLDDQDLVIEDRIDVVTRGLLGLSVQCARCHDHKYDPIPTADYYSLYGVFASSQVPKELPLLDRKPAPSLQADYLAEKARREKAYNDRFTAEVAIAHGRIRGAAGNYLLGIHHFDSNLRGRAKQRFLRERKLVPVIFDQLRRYLDDPESKLEPILRLWSAFQGTPASEWDALLEQFKGHDLDMFADGPVTSLQELAGRFNRLFSACDVPEPLADADRESLRRFIRAENSPFTAPESEYWNLVQLVREPLNALKARIAELDGEHPGAPARAMVLLDRPKPREPAIFVRGNSKFLGRRVPRQFLALASPNGRKPFENGSGRLELAEAIVDRRNPFTARVLVNRVWMHHMGTPLVSSPSDFGLRAEPPSHPDLLDWLASEFMNSGWSVKRLHRLILCSATYQQSSADSPDGRSIDPENHLYWRANRRRLELEPMRDTLLRVTGQLDLRQGGASSSLFTNRFNHRRTIYGSIDRADLPGFYQNFDLASPDVSTGRRVETSVPQQALFLMNSPFVRGLARKVTESSGFGALGSDRERLRFLWRTIFQRDPEPDEIADGLAFFRKSESAGDYWGPVGWQYGTGELNEESGMVTGFRRFSHFEQESWQAGPSYPDERSGYARLWNDGGHTSSQGSVDIVRRWTAPADGIVRIDGQVAHLEAGGDGVKAFVVSSRDGILGRWHVNQSRAQTRFNDVLVRLGDSIDFVCDRVGDHEHDSFKWIPVVEYTSMDVRPGQGEVMVKWRAKADFKKSFAPIPAPPTNWEQFVQVLLQANELHFVD